MRVRFCVGDGRREDNRMCKSSCESNGMGQEGAVPKRNEYAGIAGRGGMERTVERGLFAIGIHVESLVVTFETDDPNTKTNGPR